MAIDKGPEISPVKKQMLETLYLVNEPSPAKLQTYDKERENIDPYEISKSRN